MLVLSVFALVWCLGVWGQGIFVLWVLSLMMVAGSPKFELKGRFIQVFAPESEAISLV
jgi:hypothetical protein